MRKEYKEAIISGIVGAILVTILISKIQGKVPWTYLITFPIFFVTLKLYLIKRREAKKVEARARTTKGAHHRLKLA